jgi:hypothetical protein
MLMLSVHWYPNDSSSKDVPIGPNGEVPSSTEEVVKKSYRTRLESTPKSEVSGIAADDCDDHVGCEPPVYLLLLPMLQT